MTGLIAELKRRNVFRVGIAYLMLGWVVVQLTSIAVPALLLPDWVNSLVFLLGVIGFPFALLFAWAFELTPDGLKRSTEVDAETSKTTDTGRKLEHIAVGLLLIAVTLLVWDGYLREETGSEGSGIISQANASIAVLPFVNMSADPDQEYFSDGISEEILNVLARIPDLHVTSRSSAFSYKGKEINISDVAGELGVATILEGSVRKAGTTVRITAQLIQADGDRHLWSGTYDRELDDIFAIQDEISAAIVEQLKEHLGLKQDVEIVSNDGRSQNSEAYEAYLKGRHNLLMRTNGTINAAILHFEYAIELDPDFALAHAELAIAHMLLVDDQYGNFSFDEVFEKANPHAVRAMELAPNHPQSIAAKGFVLWYVNPSAETVRHLERASALAPNDATLLNWLAIIYGSRGDYQKSIETREKLSVIDPLSIPNMTNFVGELSANGKFEQAEKIMEKLSAIAPSNYFRSLATYLQHQGEMAGAAINSLKSLLTDPNSGLIRSGVAYYLSRLGLHQEAVLLDANSENYYLYRSGGWKKIIENLTNKQDQFTEDELLLLSTAYAALGDYVSAMPQLEKSWQFYEKRFSSGFNYYVGIIEATALIATRRASNGDADISDALRAIDEDIAQLRRADYPEPDILKVEAYKAWAVGDIDLAISKLEQASQDKDFSLPKNIFFLSELSERPEYQEMLAKIDDYDKSERDKFLNQICRENPYSVVWTPMAETCAGYSNSN